MTRLLHLSDPHFGAVEAAAAAAFISCARSLAPDFTILSGDLTMRARHSEIADAKNFVEALPLPRLLIPGNHDVPGTNQILQRFLNPFHRYKKAFGSDLCPEYVAETFHVVSTNSTRAFGLHADWSDGFLSPPQLSTIVKRFNAGPPELIRILVLHHPLLSPPGHPRAVVNPLPALLEAIHQARVDLVLCGHFHQSRLAIAGTLDGWKCVVSQASTVCSNRLQGEPQGFHEIHLSENRIDIVPYRFAEYRFIPGAPLGFDRLTAGWQDSATTRSEEIVSIS